MEYSQETDANVSSKEDSTQVFGLLSQPNIYRVAVTISLMTILIIPLSWLGIIPFISGYSYWFFKKKFRLPFRLPLPWVKHDYSNPLPGGQRGYRKGEGLLYLGCQFKTNEEIWVTNDDARRHALVLGTTGSGKALTNDTLVLTEFGWLTIDELKPGIKVFDPNGKLINTSGVFPQGKLPVVRIHFADGRTSECSRDHLWRVKRQFKVNLQTSSEGAPEWDVLTAADIGIQLELTHNMGIKFFIQLSSCTSKIRANTHLCHSWANHWGSHGLPAKDSSLDLQGTAQERINWLVHFINARGFESFASTQGHAIKFKLLNKSESTRLQSVIWSVGGLAFKVVDGTEKFLYVQVPGLTLHKNKLKVGTISNPIELEIIEVEGFLSQKEAHRQTRQLQSDIASGKIPQQVGLEEMSKLKVLEKEMTCIKIDSTLGLFVMESYLVTHNTELLLGWVSQSLMWQSGFLFVDGKGTTEFHGRAWSLTSKFGREDDYRILNFTDIGDGRDNSAGSPYVQSNTLNPFTHGTPDQLMNLIVSLMGEGTDGEMWKHRAMALVTSAIRALCDMRDAGDVLLDVQSIRDYLPLGIGLKKGYINNKTIQDVSEIPPAAWNDIRSRGGMIELYLRSLNGEFSKTSRLALKGFFDSLPGFNLSNALNGLPQIGKAAEQHGFLTMQLTKPLGSLADDYGHIFRTPFGEVDIEDIVLNRRILIVLLPALQKAPIEMQNCGRIIVAILKMMMGKVAGSTIVGSKQKLIDARPTKSPTPFMVILDEAGYYMVKGIDTMMAQARSLGFMIVVAAQDMAAMQAVSPQIAESVSANARLTIAGAMEDAHKTWFFLQRKFATHRRQVSSGKTYKDGVLGSKWVDRPDTHFVVEDRVKIGDMQKLREGEFYYLMESVLVKARSFYTGQYWTPHLRANKYLIVRGPFDLAPGLEQSKDQTFFDDVNLITEALFNFDEFNRAMSGYDSPRDCLVTVLNHADELEHQHGNQSTPILDVYTQSLKEVEINQAEH